MLKSVLLRNIKPFTCCKRFYNVVFFGSDEFSSTVADRLHSDLKHSLPGEKVVNRLAVVCAPKRGSSTALYFHAKKNELELYEYPNLPTDNFDVGVVASFGKLIPSKIINSFSHGIINIHPSLLPLLRGPSPIATAIYNNDYKTGVSIMAIEPEKFDQGKVLRQTEVIIPPFINCPDLTTMLANYGSDLLLDTFKNLEYHLTNAKSQEEFGSTVTYSKKFPNKHVYFDLLRTENTEILKHVKSHGHMKQCGVFVKVLDMDMRLYDVGIPDIREKYLLDKNDEEDNIGVSYSKQYNALYLKTASKNIPLKVTSFAIKGKPKMEAHDFFNGFLQQKGVIRIELKRHRF